MAEKFRTLPMDTVKEELKIICRSEKTLHSVTRDITQCAELDAGDIFQKVSVALNVASMITPYMQIVQFPGILCVMSKVFHKLGDVIKSRTKPNEKDAIYSELQRYQDSELRSTAIGFQKALFFNNAYLNEIGMDAAESVINSLEDKISVNEIVGFLGKLHAKTQELMQTPNLTSAYRASTYVNLYFRIAILRTLILWQVFCIKQRCGYDKSSTKGVFAMISECQNSDLEMLSNVTEANIKNVFFLAIFHPTEHESFVHFLRMHGYFIPCIGQDRRFYSQVYVIRSSTSSDVILEMSSWYGGRILGTKAKTNTCEFKFEPVEERGMDNIFHLRSTYWSDHYVYMYKDGNCYSVKDKPDLEGQWKVVKLENEDGQSRFILSTLKWPGRFLYIENFLGTLSIKSTYDLPDDKSNFLWEIFNISK